MGDCFAMSARLSPLPDGFQATLAALHRIAEDVVAAERKPDNEIALEATPGGFGTPVFEWEGSTHQIRVEGAELVREVDGSQRREPLNVDPAAAAALAGWYAFGAAALERLAADSRPGDDASAPILWPEHFDIAIELGSETDGHRATYGFSPGDEQHPEPYAYVGPWVAQAPGELWNAHGFAGAELAYADLLAAEDQAAAAFEFLASRRDALARTAP
jgi:hypothetical protein